MNMIYNFCKLISLLLMTLLSFVIVQSHHTASASLLQTTGNNFNNLAIDASGLFVFLNSTDGVNAGSLNDFDLSVSQENEESNEPDGFDDYEGEAHDEMHTEFYGSTQTAEKISQDVLPIIQENTITESTNPLIVAKMNDKLIEKGFIIANVTEAENGQTNRFGASIDDHHFDDNGLLASSKKVAYEEKTETSIEKTADAVKQNYSHVPTFPEIYESDIAVTVAEMNESQDDESDEHDGYSDYEGEMQLQKAAQNVSQNTEDNNMIRSAIGQSALPIDAEITSGDNPSNSNQDTVSGNAFDSYTETTLVSSNTISHYLTIIEESKTGGSVSEDLSMADSSYATGNPALPVLAGLILAANQF